MKVHNTHETEKIAAIAAAIEADPQCWQNWSALHITMPEMEEETFHEVARSASATIHAYLADIKGSAYFCRNRDVYVICKNAAATVLEQAAMQIDELILAGKLKPDDCRIFDLGSEGMAFVEKVFNDMGRTSPIPMHVDLVDRVENEAPDTLPERAKILLVEDDPVVRWMVRNSLKDVCDLSSADTAHKVFSLYSNLRPDITLLDIGLPDDSGRDVLEWIMRNDPAACVIMMSGRDDTENIAGCMQQGAKGFLPKPFVKNDLLHYIRKYG